MRAFSKLAYYAKSIWKILTGFNHPIPLLFSLTRNIQSTYPSNKIVSLKIAGLRFNVRNPMDIWSIKETFLDDFYRLGRLSINEDGVIFDIGAGIGEFAIQAGAKYPNCRIYGIEPFPESFLTFERNINLNNLKNIIPIQAAVSSKPGSLVMDTSTGDPLQHRTQEFGDETNKVTVPAIPLMTLMNNNQINRCDLLKLDCEGGEFDILLNLNSKDLSRFENIVMEYHDSLTIHTHSEIVNLLNASAFDVEIIPNQVHSGLGYIYAKFHGLSADN